MKTETSIKAELSAKINRLFPSLLLETHWEPDDSQNGEIFRIGGALYGEQRDDWQAWQSEVRATVIFNGAELSGNAFLGGTWQKYGDAPETVNPDISGYWKQMAGDALAELEELLKGSEQSQYRDYLLLRVVKPALDIVRPPALSSPEPAPEVKTASDLKYWQNQTRHPHS